ncbi:uncharacterized protein LOC131023270 [Salvia miltiorrhiza]|uniref:uncharacterized protein LOC131023270 n=1 Tax=Salvia miltiorrhiza TaxID=226208 RepID=UPI0025AD1769|nr:uncharacterized protein LOC131023270 [Salvia miltiorrhiza]
MACKIDIRKAFDTMSWDFILQVLRLNGYHERFIRWISVIFSSARISILYNGQLSSYFACSCGVRQGDPLSPILFGIAEDVLSHLFLNCVQSRHLVPMDFSRSMHFPTHFLYADDILLFCKASIKNARKIKEILDLYGELSGQICSPVKSRIFFADRVSPALKNDILRSLGFSMGGLPVTYLCVLLFVGRIKASYFAAIHDRIIQKFARWKGIQHSMVGRICLVRSVIQSSVTHSMMIYRWPKSLIYSLDRCCRNFIWTGCIDTKPSCSVSWLRVCSSRVEVGLGVRSFSAMNNSFLMKLAWRMVQGTDFMAEILSTRYLNSFGYAKHNLGSSSVWTSVRDHVNQLVDDSYSYIGSGANTQFWCDDWLRYRLTDKLQVLHFMHDFLKQAVDDYFFDGIWHFTPDFIITYPDIVIDILLLPVGSEADTRYWKHSVSGVVTAATAYARISQDFPKVLWGKWIWERFIPDRCSIVCWRIIHQHLPTFDGLIRRGLHGPNRCVLCGHAEESINHLFWDCDVIKPMWAELLAVIHAILIAHNRGWFLLWIEADSEYVVRLLNSRGVDVPWRFVALWKHVLAKLSDFRLQVSHIFREGNRAADIMANQDRVVGWSPYVIEEVKTTRWVHVYQNRAFGSLRTEQSWASALDFPELIGQSRAVCQSRAGSPKQSRFARADRAVCQSRAVSPEQSRPFRQSRSWMFSAEKFSLPEQSRSRAELLVLCRVSVEHRALAAFLASDRQWGC